MLASILTGVILQIVLLSSLVVGAETQGSSSKELAVASNNVTTNGEPKVLAPIGLEPRISDRNLVKDILDRLHSLDADIGKLLYNSTSMYSPNEHVSSYQDSNGGAAKFSEVLSDLDSLQDEIGSMIGNATRTRQYNILVRLRPLNTILYRIRHNLHLMRNSLVAINTVSTLEKLGNNVLDSTLQAFMKPDANLSEEIGDSGNYDINLDRLEDLRQATSTTINIPSTTITIPSTTSTTTKTTTTTTTTVAPVSSSPAASSTTKKVTQRPATRRANQRSTQKRSTTTPTTTSKPNVLKTDPPKPVNTTRV